MEFFSRFFSLDFQQIAFFADVEAARASELVGLAATFVDVSAEKHFGLLAVDKFADGSAAGVFSRREFIELAAVGRRVNDKIERLHAFEG